MDFRTCRVAAYRSDHYLARAKLRMCMSVTKAAAKVFSKYPDKLNTEKLKTIW